MNSFNLKNSTLIILFLLMAIAASGQHIEKDSFIIKLLTQEEIALSNNEVERFENKVVNTINSLQTWNKLNESERVDSFFVPMDHEEVAIKHLYNQAGQNRSIGQLIRDDIVELDAIRSKFIKFEDTINIKLFPFETGYDVEDSVKIGFVNSIDFVARTIKFLSYEGNPKNNRLANFNIENIGLDTIYRLDSIIRKTILTKFNTFDSLKIDKEQVLSAIQYLGKLDSKSLVSKMNDIGTELIKNRSALYEYCNFSNLELIRLFEPDFDPALYERESTVEIIRKAYFTYRRLAKKLTGEKIGSINELTNTYKDASINTMLASIEVGIDSDISFNEFYNYLKSNEVSDDEAINRMHYNAFGADLSKLVSLDLIDLEQNSSLFLMNKMGALLSKISLDSFEVNDDQYKLYAGIDSLHLKIEDDKVDYMVQPDIRLSWYRDDRTTVSQIITLGRYKGDFEIDINPFNEGEIDILNGLSEKYESFLDSIQQQFNLDVLDLVELKEITLQSGGVIYSNERINSSQGISVQLKDIVTLISTGEISDDIKSQVLQKIRKTLEDQIGISDVQAELAKYLDDIKDSLSSTENIDFQKNRVVLKTKVLDELVNIEAQVPYKYFPDGLSLDIKFNEEDLLTSYLPSLGGFVNFIDIEIIDSNIVSQVYLGSMSRLSKIGAHTYNIKGRKHSFTLAKKHTGGDLHDFNISFSDLELSADADSLSGRIVINSDEIIGGYFFVESVIDTFDITFTDKGYNIHIPSDNEILKVINSGIEDWLGLKGPVGSITINDKALYFNLVNISKVDSKDISKTLLKHAYDNQINEIIKFLERPVPFDTFDIIIPIISSMPIVTIYYDNDSTLYSTTNTYRIIPLIEGHLKAVVDQIDEIHIDIKLFTERIKNGYIPINIPISNTDTISVELSLNGDVDFDESQFIELGLEYIENNQDLALIQDQLQELLKIDEKFIKVTPLNQTLINGVYRVDVDFKDIASIKNIHAKRYRGSDFSFDYSKCEIDTKEIKKRLNSLFKNEEFLKIENVLYKGDAKQIGELHVNFRLKIPYFDFNFAIDYSIDLRNFNSKLDTNALVDSLIFESFRELNRKYFNSHFKDKEISYGGLNIKVGSIDIKDPGDPKLVLRSDISIPSLEFNSSYNLTFGKINEGKYKLRGEPEKIDQLIAQQAVNTLSSKALDELKKQFDYIEDFITIDSISVVTKLDKGTHLELPNGIRVESSAVIRELFEVSLPPLIITADDVEIEGPKQIKFVYKQPIPLVPPFYLYDLGGTLSEEELSGEVKFVVAKPEALRIDGTFRVPFRGDSRIYLDGDLILFDKFNLASSENYLNIKKARFTSKIETSETISDILYFRLDTDILAKGSDWYLDANGELTVFKEFEGKSDLYISKEKTYGSIALLEKAPIPLFPKLNMDLNAGYKFSNPSLSVEAVVDIKGNKIGSVKSNISKSSASVGFSFLGVDLGITVPGYGDLDEDLIWELIKRLLNPDFKNLDKALLALLGGNININPFSDFGEGGDGIGGNGNSNGKGESKAPHNNGNKSGVSKGNVVGYSGFAKLVQNDKGIRGKQPKNWEEPDGTTDLSTGTKYFGPPGSYSLRLKSLGSNFYQAKLVDNKGNIKPVIESVELNESKYLNKIGEHYYFKNAYPVLAWPNAISWIDGENLFYLNKTQKVVSFKLSDLQIEKLNGKYDFQSNSYKIVTGFLKENSESEFPIDSYILSESHGEMGKVTFLCVKKKGDEFGRLKVKFYNKNEEWNSGSLINHSSFKDKNTRVLWTNDPTNF